MLIIRPIRSNDYDALHNIAVESGHGFTSLPVNEAILNQRIERSELSFNKQINFPNDEGYLFVMEDTTNGKVVGTSGIEAAVGLQDAFYHYHLGKIVHSSHELNIYNTVETLSLCNDYTGSSEICSLFLSEKYRKDGNGRFLSRFRFLFMAEHQQRFSKSVIAEMRGVSNEDGRSPFWNWLEEHFFSMDFPTADYLTGIGKKAFIAELMPKHPIYVSLLSKDAQRAINQVHAKTIPALKLLEAEGFSRRGYVDIFDGGPTVETSLENIRTVVQSERYKVVIANITNDNRYIICNDKVKEFRAIHAPALLKHSSNIATITQASADALQVTSGDHIRLVSN